MNARTVKCPRCGKPSLFTPENAARPFCSDRCKTIDLGAWAEESYKIPLTPAAGTELADKLAEQLDEALAELDIATDDLNPDEFISLDDAAPEVAPEAAPEFTADEIADRAARKRAGKKTLASPSSAADSPTGSAADSDSDGGQNSPLH